MLSVLFVCLGNICRSPMAEAVFRHKVEELGLTSHFEVIDSAGTAGYHVGECPDSRSIETCLNHGIESIKRHRARKLETADFDKFDYILCMDRDNLRDIKARAPKGQSKAKVHMFGEWSPNGEVAIIEDPYYGDLNGFEKNFQQVVQFSEKLLSSLNL